MTQGSACPNCLSPREGRYCSVCGQNDRDYHRSFPPMVSQLVKETFELDGRALVTLKMLVTRPGELTREFSANRRARYVSPIRLYLFASILFFFILSVGAEFDDTLPTDEESAISSERAAEDVDVGALKRYLDVEHQGKLDAILARKDGLSRSMVLEWAAVAEPPKDDDAVEQMLAHGLIDVLLSPQRAFEMLVENLSIAAFVLLPVYALLLKLLYWRGRQYYAEHLVFALHVHTVAFVIFAVITLVADAGIVGRGIELLLILAFLLYCFLALRRYYEQSWLKTGIKFCLLSMSYLVVLSLAVLSVAVVTVTML